MLRCGSAPHLLAVPHSRIAARHFVPAPRSPALPMATTTALAPGSALRAIAALTPRVALSGLPVRPRCVRLGARAFAGRSPHCGASVRGSVADVPSVIHMCPLPASPAPRLRRRACRQAQPPIHPCSDD